MAKISDLDITARIVIDDNAANTLRRIIERHRELRDLVRSQTNVPHTTRFGTLAVPGRNGGGRP